MKHKLEYDEAVKLAATFLKINEDECDELEVKVAEVLYNKYELQIEDFWEIAQELFLMIDVGISPLTNQIYKGFSKLENDSGFWIAKENAMQGFIPLVINWLTNGIEVPEKGCVKQITINGKVKYEISIRNKGEE